MALLDRRVLIDAPPDIVWKHLSSLADLPRWHVNCAQTSILTSHQRGVGVRRRNTMKRGPSVVEEVVTWYEGLGYEYVVIAGPRYRRNRGYLRLQAIPEGTLVQWTFDYRLGGLFGNLRDRLLVRRRLDTEIAESLNQFKRLIQATGARMDTVSRDKVAMRPAPNATERAALGLARSQKPTEASAPTPTRETQPVPPPAEPAYVFEDDVPPLPEPPPGPLDVFADDLPPHPAKDDTKPRRPGAPPAEVTRPVAAVPADAQFRPPESERPQAAPTQASLPPLIVPEPPPLPELPERVETAVSQAEKPPEPEQLHEAPAAPSAQADPGGPSIWEVFGVPRPSEVLARAQPPASRPSAAQADAPPEAASVTAPRVAIQPPEAPAKHPGLRTRCCPTPGRVRARCASRHPGLRRVQTRPRTYRR